MLFLPETVSFDPPGLPPLDKYSLPYVGALLGGLIFAPRPLFSARLMTGPEILVLPLVFTAVMTALVNTDPLTDVGIDGLETWDGMSLGIQRSLLAVLPLILGRAYYRTPRDLRDLLAVMVIALLAYTPLILYEIRMSPQLHRIVYGSHVQWIGMSYRWGGYRPSVFFRHGLGLAMFVLAATLACGTLARARLRAFFAPTWPVFPGLAGLLVLCKSTAAIGYAAVLLPVVTFLSGRLMAWVAALLAVGFLVYPAVRISPWFPGEQIVEAAARVSEDRAESIAFRFENEDALLNRALERPLFGWGPKMRWIVTGGRATGGTRPPPRTATGSSPWGSAASRAS